MDLILASHSASRIYGCSSRSTCSGGEDQNNARRFLQTGETLCGQHLGSACCSHLQAALRYPREVKLQLLTSLESLDFYRCRALQSLPQGLHRLPSLHVINIHGPQNIISLPKEGLPDSLRQLYIAECCTEIYEACQQLKGTRPDIEVDAYKADVQN